MFRQILKQFFWDVYDHLGRLLALNLVLFFCLFPAIFLLNQILGGLAAVFAGYSLLLFWFGFVFAASMFVTSLVGSGLLYFGKLISAEKDPSLRVFLSGVRHCFGRTLLLMFVWHVVTGLLLLNVWFYFFSHLLPDGLRAAGYGLGGIFMWMTLLHLAIGAHALPLMVRKRRRILDIYKTSVALTVKYPLLTFGVILFAASIVIIGMALKFIGVMILGFIGPMMLLNSMHDVILDREMELEQRAEAENKSKRKPMSWKEIQAQENREEERRLRKARYERGLRDILRPWEM